MKSDVKRKLVTGSIEVAIGIGVLIFSWIKDTPLLYMGWLLVGSGLFTLIICGLRILMDKKAKENEEKKENGQQPGKKSIGQTIYNAITLIVVFAVVIVAGIFVFKLIKGNDDTPPSDTGIPPIIQLETPQEVSFDSENYILSWETVENASAYTIYYNGAEIPVDANDTYKQITLIAEENVFKVKAIGDGSYYSDSGWSQEVTYTIDNQQQEQSIFDKVNLKLAQAAQSQGLTLEKIIGISYFDLEADNEYGDHVRFQTICSYKGVSYNYELSFKNDGYTSSYEELLMHFDSATYNGEAKYKIVDYDSAYFLLHRGMQNNDPFDEKMEELRLQGYEISAISSVTREGKKVGSKFRFEIVGTYKAVLGSDVKYFTSINRIDILQPSSDEGHNYETFVASDKYSTVTETTYIEHEEGFTWLYMEEWVAKMM